MSHSMSRRAAVLIFILACACATAMFVPSRTHAQIATNQCTTALAARKAQIQQWLDLYAAADKAYNDLYKAVALAAHAPTGYVWDGVAPDIAQGPGITDSLDGKTILRADLYYGHDIAAQAREACRALNCESFHLPATHASAQPALDAYFAAVEAMPRFAGPIGMQLQGSPQRLMEMVDANALRDEVANSSTTCDNEQNGTQAPAELNREILQSTGPGTSQGGQPTPAANCVAPSRTLARGARGIDVTSLQKFLASRGLMASSSATGFFGALTEQAVRHFQSDSGVVSSGNAQTTGWGSVGARTLAAMRAICAQPAPAQAPLDTTNSSSSDRSIPVPKTDDSNTAIVDPPSVVDKCINIPSVQTFVPAGYIAEKGVCRSTDDNVVDVTAELQQKNVPAPTNATGKCGVNTFAVSDQCTDGFRTATVTCYDGHTETLGEPTSCKSSTVWQSYAAGICSNRCSASAAIPSVTLSQDKQSTNPGEFWTLNWSAQGAAMTACEMIAKRPDGTSATFDPYSGAIDYANAQSSYPAPVYPADTRSGSIHAEHTQSGVFIFSIRCRNANGWSGLSVISHTVNAGAAQASPTAPAPVTPPPTSNAMPTVNLTQDHSSSVSGQYWTLTWTADGRALDRCEMTARRPDGSTVTPFDPYSAYVDYQNPRSSYPSPVYPTNHREGSIHFEHTQVGVFIFTLSCHNASGWSGLYTMSHEVQAQSAPTSGTKASVSTMNSTQLQQLASAFTALQSALDAIMQAIK